MSEQPRPKVYGGEPNPELNVARCTRQIEYVARISKIPKRKLEAVFVQGLGMKKGVNWTTFYDAFMDYINDDETKARSLTEACLANNGHFISPDGNARASDGEKTSPAIRSRFATRF